MIGILAVLGLAAYGLALWYVLARRMVRSFRDFNSDFREKLREARDSGDRLAATTMILKKAAYISIFVCGAIGLSASCIAPWGGRSPFVWHMLFAAAPHDETVLLWMLLSGLLLCFAAAGLSGISRMIKKK